MAAKIAVSTEYGYNSWWENFIKWANVNYTDHHSIDEALRQFHGKDIQYSVYIEFEHEEDLTAFILKWTE